MNRPTGARVGFAVALLASGVADGRHATGAQAGKENSGVTQVDRVGQVNRTGQLDRVELESFAPAGADGVSWNRVEPGLWRDEASGRPLPAMEYATVLPRDFDASAQSGRACSVLIMLPPGAQDRAMSNAALEYVRAEAQRAGWVVIVPMAPVASAATDSPNGPSKDQAKKQSSESASLLDCSPAALERLCEHVARRVRVRGGVFHLAGVSNGGRSAFRWATLLPTRFASLTVLPGYAEDPDLTRLEALKNIPVRLFVGQQDQGWVSRAEKTRDALQKAGVNVHMQVLANEEHVLKGVSGKVILDGAVGKARANQASASSTDDDRSHAAVECTATAHASAVLDLLHERASKADERGYFELFTPDAIFLGTDASERWTTEQFRAYAAPAFTKGKGWTYHPTARRISANPAGDCVWFDEDLLHDRYGRCRGSGVLVRMELNGRTQWRIVQYNLSVPIPNEHLVNAVGLWKRP